MARLWGGGRGHWAGGGTRGRGLTRLLPLRSAGVEQLMYIKEDLIIPHVRPRPLPVTSSRPLVTSPVTPPPT